MSLLRVLIKRNAFKHLTSSFTKSQNYDSNVALKSTTVLTIIQRRLASRGRPSPRDPLDTSFEDTNAAFKSKTTWELVRAQIVYLICSFEVIVDNNMKIIKITKAALGKTLFTLAMKLTFYGHFVAGEDEERIKPTIDRLRSFGVRSILDYSVEEDISQEEAEEREVEASIPEGGDKAEGEPLKQYHVEKTFADRRYKVSAARTYFYKNEAQCEKNTEIFIESIEACAEATKGTGITAVKLTAMARPQLLLQISEVIMRARKYMAKIVGTEANVLKHHLKPEDLENKLKGAGVNDQDIQSFMKQLTIDKNGIIHLFPWTGIVDENQTLSKTFRIPDLKSGRMVRLITQLSEREEEMFRNFIRRFDTVVKAAEILDIRLMIDAEQTYFQPAIARVALEFMRKYNTTQPRVLNTYQCYLRETFNEVTADIEQAQRQNFYFGCKLVRGAYIEQERARATAMGYADPTNPNYEATSEMYHKTLSECVRRIKAFKDKGEADRIVIMVASHNEDTVRFAIQKMAENGILPQDKVILFGQLLGMCDYITFPLGQAGYSVYKYVPYGPVVEVLPYLSRRATENKGVLKKIKKEKRLLRKEIIKRLLTGKVFYTPKGNYNPV